MASNQPVTWLASACNPFQLRSQVFGRAELLERLLVVAATGVQYPGRLVQ